MEDSSLNTDNIICNTLGEIAWLELEIGGWDIIINRIKCNSRNSREKITVL
jgi:hypothetical protein